MRISFGAALDVVDCCKLLVALIFLMFAALMRVAIDICSWIGGDWLRSSTASLATDEVFELDIERSELTNWMCFSGIFFVVAREESIGLAAPEAGCDY